MLALPALLIGVSAVWYEAWDVPKWEATQKQKENAIPPFEEPPLSYRPPNGSFRRDAVELTPEFRSVIQEAKRLADRELEKHERGMGFIHVRDRTLQRILKERFQIDWRTTREMNPEINID